MKINKERKSKRGKANKEKGVITDVMNRKQLRKMKRQSKKINKQAYYAKRVHNVSQISSTEQSKIQKQGLIERAEEKQTKQKAKKRNVSFIKDDVEINEEDRLISGLEKKLGLKENRQSYSKIASKFGYDDDIFDFLDGISQKVTRRQGIDETEENVLEEKSVKRKSKLKNKKSAEDTVAKDHSSKQEITQKDQFDQMFDNIDNFYPIRRPKNRINVVAKTNSKQLKPNKSNSIADTQQTIRIRKDMNSLFNKLSDGNLILSFRQFLRIFEDNPRFLTVSTFVDLFIRFNLQIEKPLVHLLASNVALAAALHQAIGNRLMAPLMQQMSKRFIDLQGQKQEQTEVIQIGYSRMFERRKNYISIVSYLYNFCNLTAQFIQSLVNYLTINLTQHHIQFLYLLITKSGSTLRQNDPGVLRRIVVVVKQSIQTFKQTLSLCCETSKKIDIIELELNQIRFNRKTILDSDQRMGFLMTFLKKNVPAEINSEREIFTLQFQQLLQADISRTNWWQGGQDIHIETKGDQDHQLKQLSKQNNALIELARNSHMVTQVKRNIFIELLDSKDYLQATQRILQLKVKHIQDIATVLVEVCTLEPNFNPYYALVAAKLASLIPKFRLNIQYALWDHIKLVDEYSLRRTSNLAKFMARIMYEPMANCSLSMLKCFPDMCNLRPLQSAFCNIFFSEFFRKVKREQLNKLVSKLSQANNFSVRQGLKQYLADFAMDKSNKQNLQKVNICRRMLMIEVDDKRMQQDGIQ